MIWTAHGATPERTPKNGTPLNFFEASEGQPCMQPATLQPAALQPAGLQPTTLINKFKFWHQAAFLNRLG